MYAGNLAELRDRAVSIYSLLLGIETPEGEVHGLARGLPIEGEAFKQELFDLVLSFERIWLGEGPGVQVYDDLHWVDPASAELLVHLFQLAREKPVLYICAFRPEASSPAWSLKQAAEMEYSDGYTEIVLDPLPAQSSEVLLNHLLSDRTTPGPS
jgi:predicted ATPase